MVVGSLTQRTRSEKSVLAADALVMGARVEEAEESLASPRDEKIANLDFLGTNRLFVVIVVFASPILLLFGFGDIRGCSGSSPQILQCTKLSLLLFASDEVKTEMPVVDGVAAMKRMDGMGAGFDLDLDVGWGYG